MLNIQSANPEEWNGEEYTWTATRRAPRVQLPIEVPGEVNGSLAARLVDLSSHGARLEHADILRPGHRCLLSVPLGFAERILHLPSRVVWSQVRHIERQEGIVYHSGLEFQALPPDASQELGEYLGRVSESLPGPLSPLMAGPSDSPSTSPASAP